MSPVRTVFAALFFIASFVAALSAALLLQAPYAGDRAGAWFWATVFASSSLMADLCFWELP